MQEGLPLPDRIKNAPELELGLELYLQAFYDLNTSRIQGMDIGPIPWSAIDNYCERLEIEDEQRDDMFYFVRLLDSTYLKHYEKKPNTVKPNIGNERPGRKK